MCPGSRDTADCLTNDHDLQNLADEEEVNHSSVTVTFSKFHPALRQSNNHNGPQGGSEDDLLVIGVGLMRTGTKSLQVALEKLLGARCYHMTRVFEQPFHIPIWRQGCQHPLSQSQWRTLMSGYRATVDMPACVFYRDLIRIYPKAKFILSVRDPAIWYHSVRSSILIANDEMKSTLGRTLLHFTPLSQHAKMVDELCYHALGSDLDWTNEKLMRNRFEEHSKSVCKTIPKDQLLVFNPSDGWGPLCNFLNLPVPSGSYPHENSLDKFTSNWRSFIRQQYFSASFRILLYFIFILFLSASVSVLGSFMSSSS